MADLVFTLGANTFTWGTGRRFPVHDPVKVNVVTDVTDGGQLYAYNKGITEQFFYLDFLNVDQTDYDNFADWLENIAVGPLNTFTFTDEDGNNHTVRLMDTTNPLKEISKGHYAGTITLRKEIT